MLETECKENTDGVQIETEEPTEGNAIEEVDQSDVKTLNNGKTDENVAKDESEAPSALPGLCQMPQTKSGSGWGSWAASFLSTALQLDEEDDDPYTPVEKKKDDPGSVIHSQPEFDLPSQTSAIERGATEEEPNTADNEAGAGAYGSISGLGTWGSGWVSGAFTSAKQQSANAAQFLKKDLTEFATVVKKDTAGIASATSKSLQTKLNVSDESVGKFKGDVSYFLGSVKSTFYQTTTQFYSNPEDSEIKQQYDPSTSTRHGPGSCAENTLENKLSNIYKDQNTYLKDPSDTVEYEKYRSGFDVEAIKGDISNLLISQSEVRLFYSKLVPSQVSHADFWARLWFRRHAVEADFERKNEILSKVQTSLEGDLLDWGDDDDEEEYENEDQPKEPSDEKGSSHQPEREIEESESIEREKVMPEGPYNEPPPATTSVIDNDVFEPLDTGTQEKSSCTSGDTQHIEDPSSLNNTLHTPPESTTSDEWEKDFEEARNH